MAQWLGNYLFDQPLQLRQQQDWPTGQPVLNYSDEPLPGSYQVVPQGLLFETDIREQMLAVKQRSSFPCFFSTSGQHPFDLLSAGFYLLSRYEEYLPHQKDAYGRYAHTNSLAFRQGFLQRPLLDEWMTDLKDRLVAVFPELVFAKRAFSFLPTYDIDMAWSYREKSLPRQAGAVAKQALQGKWTDIGERAQVLAGKAKDPFDVFGDLDALHQQYALEPLYFFLLAAKVQGYDKNISPDSVPFRQLIQQLAQQYNTGIHLSWQAWQQPNLMNAEKKTLEEISGQQVRINRMHYIKFDLPRTFRQLLELGISKDYSMGYGSINGFRASTSRPFFWYDLKRESATSLELYPFCYMEANSIFEQKDTPEQALAEMLHFAETIKKLDGMFISIFHNHLVGYDAVGRKYWKVYEDFLLEINRN